MNVPGRRVGVAVVRSLVFVGLVVLSLACASAPEPEAAIPKATVTIDDLAVWLRNQEVSVMTTNELTSKQLMEVTKLCISSGELSDVSIVEENEVLSYAVLESRLTVSGVPLSFRFSYSISKNGTLRMRITDVAEVNETAPFSRTMSASDVDAYKASVIEAFSGRLKKIGDTVLSRAADFA